MTIVVCCATHRGLRFLEALRALRPDAEIVVFSFREEPHEPPFLAQIGAFCEAAGYRLFEARKVGSEPWMDFWRNTPVDLLFTVSWRYMVPRHVYERTRIGAYLFHDSLLPAYRGFSPTVWAILNGEASTGVTLIRMAEAIDAGEIVDQESVPIGPDDTIAQVLERVTATYLQVLERSLPALASGQPPLRPQHQQAATYCCRRLPEDNEIDWQRTSRQVHDLVRAVTRPYPGAFTFLEGRRLIVWEAGLIAPPRYVGRVPGRVVEIRSDGVVVLTGDGAVLLRRVQLEGGPETPASDVLNRTSMTLRSRGAQA
jgi:methionyl-tRNA formyltransferase